MLRFSIAVVLALAVVTKVKASAFLGCLYPGYYPPNDGAIEQPDSADSMGDCKNACIAQGKAFTYHGRFSLRERNAWLGDYSLSFGEAFKVAFTGGDRENVCYCSDVLMPMQFFTNDQKSDDDFEWAGCDTNDWNVIDNDTPFELQYCLQESPAQIGQAVGTQPTIAECLDYCGNQFNFASGSVAIAQGVITLEDGQPNSGHVTCFCGASADALPNLSGLCTGWDTEGTVYYQIP